MNSTARKRAKKEKPIVKSFNCPNCGAALNITAVGRTISVVCKSCRATLDATDPNFAVLELNAKKRTVKPAIPVGTRGTIGGKMWECVGFMQRGDDYGYRWHEYLLFNPYHGYRWLFEFDGHWTWFKRSYEIPDLSGSDVKYKGKNYKLFTKGSSKVFYVEGEFYWRVKVGDKSKVKDYVSAPYTVSFEKLDNEIVWTHGQYLDPQRVKNGFKLKENSFPEPVGIAPNQPSPHKKEAKQAFKYFFYAALFLIVIHLFRTSTALNKEVFSHHGKREFPIHYGDRSKLDSEVIKTRTFRLERKRANLKLKASSNVNNSWIWIDSLLVNEETGKGIPMPIEVSYYHGYSGGESWSEGRRQKSRIIQNVPPEITT